LTAVTIGRGGPAGIRADIRTIQHLLGHADDLAIASVDGYNDGVRN
jgi:hypothetical protein